MVKGRQGAGTAGRRQRERDAHRREILAAAERVFKVRGLEAAKMEEIAREAEFSVGSLYNFFRNKDELCAAVIGGIADEFIREFENSVLPGEDALEALKALVRLRLTHMRAHREFFRMMLALKPESGISPDMVLLKDLRAVYGVYVKRVAELFRRAMRQGRVRKMDPLYAALAMEGVINAYSAHWGGQEQAEPIDRLTGIIWDNYLCHIVKGKA